jgi:hypothetical protein
MSATLASQLLRRLQSVTGTRVTDEGEAIRCRITRGSVQVVIVVPTGVLEWCMDAVDTQSGLSISDWAGYSGYDDTPADELDRDMADDVMTFAAQLLIRELRLVAPDGTHGQLEWKIDGEWRLAKCAELRRGS